MGNLWFVINLLVIMLLVIVISLIFVPDRRWLGITKQIVDLLSRDCTICDIRNMTGVSRGSYYKRKQRPSSNRDINREKVIGPIRAIRDKHPTHGYRWIAAYIDMSENYVYKCFRFLGIGSETKYQVHYKPHQVRDKYLDLIYSAWETAPNFLFSTN